MNIKGFEIERKYLIRFPGEKILKHCEGRSEITQTYLKTENEGESERVRKRVYEDKTEYTHTVKKRLSDMRRVENESEINEEEYRELLRRADPKRRTIEKRRYCLAYEGKIFEIDIYPFWSEKAVMEVELESEEDNVKLPPEMEIIREITGDKRYTNAAIAKKIPEE